MAFTQALAKGAREDGIRVLGINPGPVATERYDKWIRRHAELELGDANRWLELARREPFGRAAKPEEIASAVCFLASPRSAYTTGTVLTIDGAGR
jgi:NAD(P)-dependent dehydrogenase (short-subunit alcohol dehydrogenase family)